MLIAKVPFSNAGHDLEEMMATRPDDSRRAIETATRRYPMIGGIKTFLLKYLKQAIVPRLPASSQSLCGGRDGHQILQPRNAEIEVQGISGCNNCFT
jgi:hypothetical protein